MSSTIEVSFSGDISDYVPKVSELYDDQRTLFQMIYDRSMSLLREVNYVCDNLRIRLSDYFNPTFDHPKSGKTWHVQSEGLYVLIHGLSGHPGIWQTHLNILKKEVNKDVFVPYVPLKGNGPLEDVAGPLLTVIKDYVVKHPTKPICLIGVSNGGRICTWLETQLRTSMNPVKVSTIAAVHFGTSRMDLVKLCYEWTGWSLGYDISVVNDLCFASEKAKRILETVSQPLPKGVIREFEFFASTEDSQVPGLSSSMPKLGIYHKPVNHVVHGYDHSGIVAGVALDQIRSCMEWMTSISN